MANPINPSVPALTQGSSSGPSVAASSTENVRQTAAPGGSPAPVPAPVVQKAPSAAELAEATRDISEYIQTVSRNLDRAVDDQLGRTVITVLDAESEEVVRQIPSEEILAIARFLQQQRADSESADPVPGLLFNKET